MTDLVLDPSQERAVELVLSARVGVVTGGPGTGKTTCLRIALDRLDSAGGRVCGICSGQGVTLHEDEFGNEPYPETCKPCSGRGRISGYALAAPTGKAARRMSEATGRAASTVHRLLDFGPTDAGEFTFRCNRSNPIDCDLVIIDESSMLDVDLAAAILRGIDPVRTRVIFVGDANQLPSVGPGRVFADLIASSRVEVARLTTLHRAAQESWVCTQAPRFLEGELPAMDDRNDFLWFSRDDRDQASATLVKVVTDVLPRRGVSAADVQVLVPQRKGPAGTEVLNPRLQALLNPPRPQPDGSPPPSVQAGAYVLRAGDRVIQTMNNYSLAVMNGEVGVVEVVREREAICPTCNGAETAYGDLVHRPACETCGGRKKLRAGVVVSYPDGPGFRRVHYGKHELEHLELAYALTIHKSQGSEWPWVVVLVHSTHTRMLTRQLAYTAITRARKGVVLVGDMKGLERAVEETRESRRNTGLVERLQVAVAATGAAAAEGIEAA